MPRGGKRPGSGRPKKDNAKKQMPIYVSGDLAEYLREHGATKVVEATVPKSKAFREWKRLKKNLAES